MMRMFQSRRILLLLGFVSLPAASPAADGPFAILGPCTGPTVEIPLAGVGCGPTLLLQDDGVFENGYAWQYGGVCPPFGGAFAQPFSGSQTICALEFGFTQTGNAAGNFMDVYIWDDDNGRPGSVRCIRTDVTPGTIAFWPSVSFHSIDIQGCCTPLRWWAGFWGAWPGSVAGWYVGADANGASGFPQTYDCVLGMWDTVETTFGPTEALAIRARSECVAPAAEEYSRGEWRGEPANGQPPQLYYGELRIKGVAVHKTSDVGKADAWIDWAAGHSSCYAGAVGYPKCLDLQQAGSFSTHGDKFSIKRSKKWCLPNCDGTPFADRCADCAACDWYEFTGTSRVYVEDQLLSPNFTSPITFHVRVDDANHKWRDAAKALTPHLDEILKCSLLNLQACKDLLKSIDNVWQDMETFANGWDGRHTTLGELDYTYPPPSIDECFNLRTRFYDPDARTEYLWAVFAQQTVRNGETA